MAIDQERREYNREWLKKNRDHVRQYRAETRDQRNARRRELYSQDEERRKAACAAAQSYKEANPERRRRSEVKKLYGLTPEEFEALKQAHGGLCAICKTDGGKCGLYIDHCHTTKSVRGLLCGNCNQALGKFKDDVSRIEAAIAYLKRGCWNE